MKRTVDPAGLKGAPQNEIASSIALDARQAAAVLGIAERTFHALRKRDGFPRPRNLSTSDKGRIVRWARAELEAWFAALPPSEMQPEPAQLAGRRFRDGKPLAARASRSPEAQ